jgi:TPR repeat protein
MYEYGKGIKKNINIANYWYEKSARQGYQYAQNKLNKLKRALVKAYCYLLCLIKLGFLLIVNIS